MAMQVEEIDHRLDALAREVTTERVPRALARNIDLGFEGGDAMPLIAGDDFLLREMLGNLIDNASKWTNQRVDISLQGNTLVVADDGPGCPPDMLNALTQRGFRADENTPGSGLGLAIAQDIAGTYGAVLEFANNSPGLVVRITFKPGSLV